MQEFVRQGKFDLNHLKRKRRQVQHDLKELAEYFGIDTLKSKPTEVFTTVKQLIKDLTTANENLTKKALSRKNSSRAMMRSASTPSFKRSSRNSSFRGSRNSSAKSSRNSSARSSIRRAYRSISVASTGSDVKMQDEKDCGGTAVLDDQRSCASSKSSSSELSSFYLNRSYSDNYSQSTPKSHFLSNRNGLHRTRCDNEDDANERPKEPDLSKYRLLMKEYEEKRKRNVGKEEIKIDRTNISKESDKEWKDEQLRKVLLSPVREKSERRNLSGVRKEVSNKDELVQDLKTKSQHGNEREIYNEVKGFNERKLKIKEQRAVTQIEENEASKEHEENNRHESKKGVRDEKVKVNGVKDDACGKTKMEWDTDENHNEIWMKKREPDLSRYRQLMKERPEELKTLHYRSKNEYEKEGNRMKETIVTANEKRYEKPVELRKIGIESDQKKEIRGLNGFVNAKKGERKTVLRDDTKGNLDWKIGQDEKLRNDVKVHEDRCKTENIEAVNGNKHIEKRHCDELEKDEVKSEYRNGIENNDGNSNEKSTNNKSNSSKNFVRGSTSNSLTRNRNSLRNSLRNERRIKKVNVKAMYAKDVVKTMTSSKSDPNLGNGKLLRRRTKSEGIQAVILKPGFIAKNVPIKLELMTAPSSKVVDAAKDGKNEDKKTTTTTSTTSQGKEMNGDGRTTKTTTKKEDKWKEIKNEEVFVDDSFELKEKDGPVLRRTKSAVIHRNLREAKLIFFL